MSAVMVDAVTCRVDTCEDSARVRGLCQIHYRGGCVRPATGAPSIRATIPEAVVSGVTFPTTGPRARLIPLGRGVPSHLEAKR